MTTDDKLLAMVHFIIHTTPSRSLGKTKLNKILWFSDRMAYLRYGKSISETGYTRMQYGSTADGLDLALRRLEGAGNIKSRHLSFTTHDKYEFYSFTEPDLASLSKEEITIMADTIVSLSSKTAKEVSELSHDKTWRMYENGEKIPLCAILATQCLEPTPEDLAWAMGEEAAYVYSP